jgi:hypothetical protein
MFPRSQPFSLSSSGDAHAGDFEDISTRTLQSVRVGQSAGKLSSGQGNAFVGFEAGKVNVQGSFNAMVGYQAGAQNANASYATMVGAYAGAQNQRGSEVTFVGFKAGELSKDGNQLVGVGAFALRENVSGNGTVAIGYRSAERTLDGYFNTMIGTESGQDNRSGNFNTMAGYRSGRSAFLGNENTYLGAFSGYSNRRGSANSFVGYRAGEELQNGDFNVAIGAYSMRYASSGSCNIAIGPFAGTNVSQNASENVLIGTQVSANGSPNRSVILGALAGSTMTGDGSVLIGYKSGDGLEIGNCNILIGTGATTYTASNNLGIAIGSYQTVTYTHSLSIGNEITNQREYSILMGNDISSDADNAIILGKANSIESFVVWKDPISESLQNAVLNDGINKIGLSAIDYSDMVISPCNEIYSIATAKIYASNLESSLTNPSRGNIGPATYDLRQYVPEHIIHHGLTIVARNEEEYAWSNAATIWTSNAVQSSSKPFSLSPSTVSLDSIQHNTHTSAVILLDNHNGESNIAVNIRSLSNVSSSIPIDCAFHHVPPSPSSNWVGLDVPRSAISNIEYIIPLSNITLSTSCNLMDGVFLTTPSNQLRYIVETPPQYGILNHAIYASLDDILYQPFAECAMTTSDEFVVRPYYFLRDGDHDYGIISDCNSTVHVTFNPASNELFVPNYAILSNQVFVFDSNLLQRVPPIATNEYVYMMSMPPNILLHTPYRVTPYTSNDIQRIVLCNVYDYPPEAYDSYLLSVDAKFSNVNYLHREYASNLSYALYDIIDYSTQLLTYVTTPGEISTVNDITAIAQAILDIQYPPTPITSNATEFLSSKVDEWRTLYDPTLNIYVPWSQLITESNQAWYNGYLTSGFYDSWNQTEIASNQFVTNLNNAETLSNIAISYQTDVATNISFDAQIQEAAYEVYPLFNTIFRAYFRERRIFITYQDIIDGTVYLSSNVNEAPIPPQSFDIRVGNVQKSVPIQVEGKSNNVWSDVGWTSEYGLRLRLPYTCNMETTTIDFTIYDGYSKHYVLRDPLYGRFENSNYVGQTPWASNEEFTLILENDQMQTVDLPVYIDYDAGHRFAPITLIEQPSSFTAVNSVTYIPHESTQVQIFASNIVEKNQTVNNVLQSSEITADHIPIYDPNIGYKYVTSNETIQITINELPSFGDIVYTCNLHYQKYTFDAVTSVWTEFPAVDTTFQESFQQPSIIDLASNIEYNYSLIIVTSNLLAYNSNIQIIDRDSTYITYRDAIENTYLYGTAQEDIPRPTNEHTIITSSTVANSSTLSIATNYVTAQSNITSIEGYVPITKHHISFAGYPTISFTPTSLSNCTIVRSNVGPVASATYDDIVGKKVWIQGSSGGSLPTSLGPIQVNVASGTSIIETLSSFITFDVTLDDLYGGTMDDIFDACASRFPGSFSPLSVHIYDVKYGYITRDGSNVATTCPWIDRMQLKYIGAPATSQDTIQIFFSNPSAVTNVFSVPIYVNFTPSSFGQVVNMGVSTQLIRNTLSPRRFYYSYDNAGLSIQISANANIRFYRKTNTAFLIVNLFTIQEVVDGRIYIEFLANISQYTFQYDVRRGGSTLFSNKTFTLYRLNHVAHMPASLDEFDPYIDFTCIGEDTTYLNAVLPVVTSWYSSLMSFNDVSIPPSGIQMHICERPELGILVHISDPVKIVTKCSLDDLIQNKIRYISYNPAYIQEDYVGVQFVLPNMISSPIIRFHIRHFYSHFHPLALNTSSISTVSREVPTPLRSISMENAGYPWTTSCNTIVPYDNTTNVNQYPTYTTLWTLPTITSNVSSRAYTYAANAANVPSLPISSTSISVDQADYVSLDTLSNIVPVGNLYEMHMYILSFPKWGVILNKQHKYVVNKCSIADLLSGDIIYQHMGVQQPTTDSFVATFAFSPYTLSTESITVDITVQNIPTIFANTNKYVYYSSFAQSNTIHPFTQNDLSFTGNGFIHVIQESNLQVVNLSGLQQTTFSTNQTTSYGYRIDSNIFDEYPYPPSSFKFTMNSHPELYANSLYTYEPYRDVFIHDYTSYTNQHTDINVILADTDRYQTIAYDINNTSALQSALINRIITMSFELYPEASYSHPQFDLFLTDHFTFTLFNDTGYILRFAVYNKTWTLEVPNASYTGIVPTSLTRNAWNTLKFVNYDPRNESLLSLFWKYQSGEEVNLLQNINVTPVPIEQCVRYELLFDIQSPLLYTASSNYVKQLSSGLRTNFTLENSYQSYHVRNFQINVSTYTIDDDLTYDPDSHNIIIGKDINVQGVNNICVGNTFVTSGNQSIILGNSIGGGVQGFTTVNDIFQSIIVGNESFRNSIVRDIICIGNNNFNNLSEQDTERTRNFFAQKPIVIGNSVDADKIDYNINIGNVFMNTAVGSKQIYLGQDGQCVAIGYSSNEAFSAVRNKLYVNGCVQSEAISTSQHLRTVICTNAVSPYFVMNDVADSLYDAGSIATTAMSPLVCGISKQSYIRTDGAYDIFVVTRGKTQVWCKSAVLPGELLVSDDYGCVVSRGTDTTMHSYTFAKSLSTWDPNNPSATPTITTSNIAGYGDIGLISCIVLI